MDYTSATMIEPTLHWAPQFLVHQKERKNEKLVATPPQYSCFIG